MAIVKCHALKGNVQTAINYIINPDKVAAGCVGSKGVNINVAGLSWSIRQSANNKSKSSSSLDNVTGYHFIQSFPFDSITADEANDMAKEWIDNFLQDNYDYVLATHVDQRHVHTHIIVNSMNNITGKQMDMFFRRDIEILRKMSDEVCKAHGKETIETKNRYSKPYYEWMQKNQGDTYKDIVRKTIDDIIPKVKNTNEFILYLRSLGFEVEVGDDKKSNQDVPKDNRFKFSVNEKLINFQKETDTHYYLRMPYSKDYVYIPKENCHFTSDGKTLYADINTIDDFGCYDSTTKEMKIINGSKFKINFENKGKEQVVRKGLRIKPPGSNKFIRCKRFNKNENDEGYSFEDIKERIENNGRYVSDPEVETFIHQEYTNQQKEKNKEKYYKDMNFKEGFKNSKYTTYTPKERYIYMKMKNINSYLDEIREMNNQSNKPLKEDLKSKKDMIISELDKINDLLKKKERECEEIIQKRMEGELVISEAEFDTYIEKFITPLRVSKEALKEMVQDIDKDLKSKEAKENTQER